MKLNDYKKLVECEFISRYGDGYIQFYFSSNERAEKHDLREIEKELMKQLTCDFDYNNCVILFPLATRCGTSLMFNNREIVIDHCTYVLDIFGFLKSKGITWHDGSKFKVDQSIPVTKMLIVENGLATIVDTANPLQKSELIGDKEIFFSGFLVNRIRNNKA